MKKQNMNFLQAFNQTDISLLGDADKDRVPNVFDCKPYNEDHDGFFGRMLNVLSRGRYGQSKENFETEQILKRVEQKHKIKGEIEQQEAKNALIKQKLELQKLKSKEQQLRYLQSLSPSPPSPSQMMYNAILGIPLPKQKGLQLGRPGYEIVYSPKLPKGYRWKKISKKEQKERTTSEAVEHRFTHPGEAVRFQQYMMQIYGYMPEILQVINPANGIPFFVVIEPVGLRRIR